MSIGADLIAQERARQVQKEGWTPEHDAGHSADQLARAAAFYALPDEFREFGIWGRSLGSRVWPWPNAPKPGARIRELTKAGALIAAEIDRLSGQ
jgi:hypothetical protein